MKKKFDKDTALAKVSTLIKKHYEDIGREEIIEIDMVQQELVENIEEILNNTDISVKHLVIERLEADDEIKNSLKGRWEADGTFK
jgi:hypothetical protein